MLTSGGRRSPGRESRHPRAGGPEAPGRTPSPGAERVDVEDAGGDLLGVSPQTVSEWVAQHKLVGLKDGREWRFPAWQFTPDNAEPVLPDLDRLVATFPGGEVSLSRWMNRANDNFAGRTRTGDGPRQ